MFPGIYARIAEKLGSAKQKDVAAALGMTQGYINNLLAVAKGKHLPKGPTTLPYKQLIEWATANNVSVDWLLAGREPCPEQQGQPQQVISRAHEPSLVNPPAPEVARDVGMAWSILESNTSSAHSLQTNIHDFYKLVFGVEALADQVGVENLHEADQQALAVKRGRKIVTKSQGIKGRKRAVNGS
jgi:hypothetical protein